MYTVTGLRIIIGVSLHYCLILSNYFLIFLYIMACQSSVRHYRDCTPVHNGTSLLDIFLEVIYCTSLAPNELLSLLEVLYSGQKVCAQ